MKRKVDVKLRKVPVKPLIDMLMEAYNSGLDFVDIVGNLDMAQDMIGLGFYEDYYSKEPRTADEMYIEEEEGYDPNPPNPQPLKIKKLTKDELDKLMNL